MKTFEQCCHYVAKKHGLGKTLVTGRRAVYFTEAAELYANEKLKGLLEEVMEMENIWGQEAELTTDYPEKCICWGEQTAHKRIATRIEELINETK